jgi:hypothetical protein
LQNVSTKLRERISSDEEERLRQGYELRTAFCFTEHDNTISARMAEIYYSPPANSEEKKLLATLTYGMQQRCGGLIWAGEGEPIYSNLVYARC